MKKGKAEVLRPRFYLQKTRPHNRAMAPRTKRGFRPNLGHVFENGALASTWAAFFMAAASKTRPKAPVSCSGYSENMLATAFDHLCENEKAARGFLTKNARLRKLWLDGFLFSQL